MRLHILPKVLRGNDKSSTKFNSKLNVNFLVWPVFLKDSFARMVSLLFWLLATNSSKYISGKYR